MFILKPLFLLTVLLICQSVSAQRQLGVRPTDSGGPLMPEQAAYDVRFIDLQLAVIPDHQSIAGELTLSATVLSPLEWLVLDLDSTMTVHQVKLLPYHEKQPAARFERRGKRLWIHLRRSRQPGEELQAAINYSGKPKVAPAPPWAGGFSWEKTAAGKPWIATSVQNDGADLWWPCKDHPSDEPDSMLLRITVPQGLYVASNGVLRQRVANDNDTETFNWFIANPINNYNVALNIAPYQLIEDSFTCIDGTVMPFRFYLLPESLEKGRKLFPELMEHMRFYERILGPYPFRNEKYGVAETPFLGMEHQTIIAYGNKFRPGVYGYDLLHHHELGHEWWGNLVTALDWRDFWLHEGLCAYMHGLYNEERSGEAAYHAYFNAFRPRIRNLTPVAPREAQTTTQRYFLAPAYTESDGDVYNKGSMILHALRFLIGKEAILQSLRRFAYPDSSWEQRLDGSQCRFATTDDYLQTAEACSGRQLDWFFEVYLRNAPLPELHLKRTSESLVLSWKTSGDLPFPMPLEIAIDEELRRYDFVDGELELRVPRQAEVRVDPKNWVLKKVVEVQ